MSSAKDRVTANKALTQSLKQGFRLRTDSLLLPRPAGQTKTTTKACFKTLFLGLQP